MVPASLMAAVFPAFTLALGRAPQEARQLGSRATMLLLLWGAGAAAVLWLLAPWLITLLYGEHYRDSVAVLRLLALSTLPAFVNYSLTHYLIARGQQGLVGLFTGTMLLLHWLLCWFTIPLLGIIAPALSTIVAETFLFCACLIALSRTRPRATATLAGHSFPSTPPPPQP
jgi:O-antigen/teichoic acid export membrane protein